MSAFEEQELKKLEAALGALTPRPARLDRDRLLFEAGHRSARPNRLWCWSTAGMAVIACLLSAMLIAQLQGPPERIVEIVRVETPSAIEKPPVAPPEIAVEGPDEESLSPSSYGKLRQVWTRGDIEHLPAADVDERFARRPAQVPIPTVGARSVGATLLLTGDN